MQVFSDISNALCANSDSDQVVRFVSSSELTASTRLTKSQRKAILRDGVYAAYIEDEEITVVIDGGDEPIATGLDA